MLSFSHVKSLAALTVLAFCSGIVVATDSHEWRLVDDRVHGEVEVRALSETGNVVLSKTCHRGEAGCAWHLVSYSHCAEGTGFYVLVETDSRETVVRTICHLIGYVPELNFIDNALVDIALQGAQRLQIRVESQREESFDFALSGMASSLEKLEALKWSMDRTK
jgi:hypothetical protein